MDAHAEVKSRFYPMIGEKGQNTVSAGDTNAVQVWPMDVPRELYHTDWGRIARSTGSPALR